MVDLLPPDKESYIVSGKLESIDCRTSYSSSIVVAGDRDSYGAIVVVKEVVVFVVAVVVVAI